jgi:hypothetical protein
MITSLLFRSLFSRQSLAVSVVPVPRAAGAVWLAPDSARGGHWFIWAVWGDRSPIAGRSRIIVQLQGYPVTAQTRVRSRYYYYCYYYDLGEKRLAKKLRSKVTICRT